MEEPSAGEREGPAPRMEEPSAGEREGPAPRMEEPSAGEREGPCPSHGMPAQPPSWRRWCSPVAAATGRGSSKRPASGASTSSTNPASTARRCCRTSSAAVRRAPGRGRRRRPGRLPRAKRSAASAQRTTWARQPAVPEPRRRHVRGSVGHRRRGRCGLRHGRRSRRLRQRRRCRPLRDQHRGECAAAQRRQRPVHQRGVACRRGRSRLGQCGGVPRPGRRWRSRSLRGELHQLVGPPWNATATTGAHRPTARPPPTPRRHRTSCFGTMATARSRT